MSRRYRFAIVALALFALAPIGCADKVSGKSLTETGAYDSTAQSENVAQFRDTEGNVWTMATQAAGPTQSKLRGETIDMQTTGPVVALTVGPWKILSSQDGTIKKFKSFDAAGNVTSEIDEIQFSASSAIKALDVQAQALFTSLVQLGEQQALVEIQKLKTQGQISDAMANALVAAVKAYFTPGAP